MIENNSGKPSAEEILKMEEDLGTLAEQNQGKPSEFEDDDDEEQKPPKKETKKAKVEDDNEEEDEEEDEDDGDIEDDDLEKDDDDDIEDDDDKGDKSKDKPIPAWMVKMNERRLNKAVEDAKKQAREEFEAEHGRKPNAEEKKDLEDDLASDFEKEFGVAPDENTKKFLGWLEKRTSSKMSPELTERMAKIEQDALEKAEEIGFEQDFTKQKKLLDKYFPEADTKVIDRIKAKVKELAYTEKYAKYDLADIIRLNRKSLAPVERKKTGEASRGGTGQARYTPDQIDPEKIDWKSMSVEEADKVMTAIEKNQGKKSRMQIFRKGKRIN